MAKSPPPPSRGERSTAIRAYLAEHPEARTKEVVAALREQGIEVTAGLVSNIKYGKRSPAGTTPGVARRRGAGGNLNLTVDDLIEIKQLADRIGGVEVLRRALDVIDLFR